MLVLALTNASWRKRGFSLLRLAGGFALFFLPYLFFNLQIQGSLWPNTFYAKQAEYAALQERSLALRVLDELSLPLIGAGMLLLPGFIRSSLAGADRAEMERAGGRDMVLGLRRSVCLAAAGDLPIRALFDPGDGGIFCPGD